MVKTNPDENSDKGVEDVEAVIIVAIVFVFVTSIVKMSFRHAERMEKIKRGYPLDDEKDSRDRDFIDARSTEQGERLQ